MTSPDIDAARDDVLRTRAQLADTLAQLSERVTGPIATAKEKLNLVEVARNNPWPALAVAFGAGALIAATGTDARAASAARMAGEAGVEGARKAALTAAQAARSAPSRSRRAFGDAADAIATRCVLSLIGALKEDQSAAQAQVPTTTAIGYVENRAPEHESKSAAELRQ